MRVTNNGMQTMTDMTRGRWVQRRDKYIVGRKKNEAESSVLECHAKGLSRLRFGEEIRWFHQC